VKFAAPARVPPRWNMAEKEKPKRCKSDFSTICPHCLVQMIPVHSHYQCTRCGWRDSCCF
jgi:hypothetical protein